MMSSDAPFKNIHALIRRQDFDQALSLLQSGYNGKIRREFSHDRNHAWYCVGDIKYQKNDFRGAIKAFKNAFLIDSSDVACLIAIGNCYDQLRKFNLAARYFLRALGLSPRGKLSASPRFNLANALFEMNRLEFVEAAAIAHAVGLDQGP